eukprot:CAMPEP_0176351566 /NCGR_PEP_ID=MMETSP0126-20121128/10327_1 /TAXON_ID=141414 ORGANISM="Strombidinopsis acuminatum, Strain SPMC142" /NCGR_SAMPLE_ID=MMETSP0126 /ASSEMBLY_ACC=CAM_ASM_000229 /LENGTH=81 /DNA_ID=CAMNT_0017702153 /DNA_START=362 /DNA_END=607 /DNA_ORIENTATION=+
MDFIDEFFEICKDFLELYFTNNKGENILNSCLIKNTKVSSVQKFRLCSDFIRDPKALANQSDKQGMFALTKFLASNNKIKE